MDPVDLSIVVPLFNEAESLEELYSRVTRVLRDAGLIYEILFVDDGSTDTSFPTLEKLHGNDPRVRAIRLRRNYGKSAALSTGFKYARGRYIVTLDADLQDDPREIPRLLAKLEEGFDLVSGWKWPRKDPLSKRLPSRILNALTAWLTGVQIHDVNCGLKAYRRCVIEEVDIYGEQYRFIPILAHWRGFKVGEVKVTHHPRRFGKSKFGPARFLAGIFDLITVLFLNRYMKKPLHFFGLAGGILFLMGFGITGYLGVGWFFGRWIGDRPLFPLGILLLILGIQFISTGLIGEMLTKFNQKEKEYSIHRRLGC